MYIYVYMHIQKNVRVRAQYTYTHTQTHECAYTYIHTSIYRFYTCMYTCTHIFMYTCTYMAEGRKALTIWGLYAYVCVCVCVCVFVSVCAMRLRYGERERIACAFVCVCWENALTIRPTWPLPTNDTALMSLCVHKKFTAETPPCNMLMMPVENSQEVSSTGMLHSKLSSKLTFERFDLPALLPL